MINTAIERTLFANWEYRDEGYSLRWDPIEDQRYALRWGDPSKLKLTENAANCLAFEALRCLPCVPVRNQGAHDRIPGDRAPQGIHLAYLDAVPLRVETVRSLLSLRDLHAAPLPRTDLEARGIQEVYSAAVIRPNQYYSNFAPAQPVT